MIGKTLVIGFGHKARQGKNQVADFIHEAHPRDTRLYSFADALRVYCRVVHGMTLKDAPLLQRVGVEMREQRGPHFWVNILEARIREEQPKVALVTDVRFPNEARWCDATIKVTRLVQAPQRTTGVLVPYVAQDRPANHPSETALDGYPNWWSEITARDGDLQKLKQDALACYDAILSDAQTLAFIAGEEVA
jgi:hypothetical protein